jgi:S-adenosyl methyltransferase
MTRTGNAAGRAGPVTSGQEPAGKGVPFDTSRAHMAGVYDFWLGGKDNFAADREVAERVAAAYPDVLVAVRAQRAFLARAVHFLVTQAGIRQFLDIGTGLPSANNTHQVAQEAAAQSRVVYVDNDRCKSGCAHARVGLGLQRWRAVTFCLEGRCPLSPGLLVPKSALVWGRAWLAAGGHGSPYVLARMWHARRFAACRGSQIVSAGPCCGRQW